MENHNQNVHAYPLRISDPGNMEYQRVDIGGAPLSLSRSETWSSRRTRGGHTPSPAHRGRRRPWRSSRCTRPRDEDAHAQPRHIDPSMILLLTPSWRARTQAHGFTGWRMRGSMECGGRSASAVAELSDGGGRLAVEQEIRNPNATNWALLLYMSCRLVEDQARVLGVSFGGPKISEIFLPRSDLYLLNSRPGPFKYVLCRLFQPFFNVYDHVNACAV